MSITFCAVCACYAAVRVVGLKEGCTGKCTSSTTMKKLAASKHPTKEVVYFVNTHRVTHRPSVATQPDVAEYMNAPDLVTALSSPPLGSVPDCPLADVQDELLPEEPFWDEEVLPAADFLDEDEQFAREFGLL